MNKQFWPLGCHGNSAYGGVDIRFPAASPKIALEILNAFLEQGAATQSGEVRCTYGALIDTPIYDWNQLNLRLEKLPEFLETHHNVPFVITIGRSPTGTTAFAEHQLFGPVIEYNPTKKELEVRFIGGIDRPDLSLLVAGEAFQRVFALITAIAGSQPQIAIHP